VILVFGKTGQVATELQRLSDVVALGREQVNLADSLACSQAIYDHAPDIVINAAAYTAVDGAEAEELIANSINGAAPAAMALSCAKLGIPLVHISTDYVFDGSGKVPWLPYDFIAPLNAYGRSKFIGEEGIRASGATYAIIRTSWVFSEHGKNFVKTMLRLSETCDVIRVVNDQIGGPTPAHDVADACLRIAEQLQQDYSKSGTYHFSGVPNVSWAEFASNIFQQAGRSLQIVRVSSSAYNTLAKRPLNSRLDCSKTQEIFKIKQPDWKIGLSKILKELDLSHDEA
jgi:dTDP-4-dehydrorhamnose reductase